VQEEVRRNLRNVEDGSQIQRGAEPNQNHGEEQTDMLNKWPPRTRERAVLVHAHERRQPSPWNPSPFSPVECEL